MKRMGIVLLGAVCLISSYAFSHASDIHFKKISSGEVVEFAWDETTNLKSKLSLDTEISWSDNEDCTNRNPFAVKVEN